MRRKQYIAAIATTLVVIIGYLGFIIPQELINKNHETFPFFSWSLFAQAHRTWTRYEILVQEIDGKKIEPPVRMQELTEYFPKLPMSVDKATQSMANALENKKHSKTKAPNAAKAWQHVIENPMRSWRDVKYQLVMITYDPIQRWNERTVLDNKVLGEYHFHASDCTEAKP